MEKGSKEKGKKKFIRSLKHVLMNLSTQRMPTILMLAAQLVLLFYMTFKLEKYSAAMQALFQLLAAVTAVYIINRKYKSEFRIGWLVPMAVFPVFTVAAYFMLTNQFGTRAVRKLSMEKCLSTKPYLEQDKALGERLKNENEEVYRYSLYMNDYAGFPMQTNSKVTYFRSGEEKFEVLKDELRKAKHYIFIEMFIVDQGSMLDELLDILKEKAAQGLDVRFIYDGMGSQHLLPFKFDKTLTEQGIKTCVFQPFVPMLSSIQNNRDHRKIFVIDGHTGFTGGDNIADEYVNRIVRFGYWKDTSVMIKGDAVWNLTMMFLQMWEVLNYSDKPADYNIYRPEVHSGGEFVSDGYVLPYGDSPLDNEDVGELTYLQIINAAKDYCYISTPYLILNEELSSSLKYAAKRGVDVRILVPGIPDKWYVKVLGMSYFDELIEAGVRIYEYYGFNHAKMFVSDDVKAVVGTINLDYRSLYLHFENACYLYKSSAIKDIKSDFEDIFANKSREVTEEDCRNRPKLLRFLAYLLKVLEPLL